MLHRIVIDIDGKNDWRTIVVEMANTIEKPNVYKVHTTITDEYKKIYETTETKGHEQALKYFLAFKNFGFLNSKDCASFEINHKETFITEKNAYISEFEFMKKKIKKYEKAASK